METIWEESSVPVLQWSFQIRQFLRGIPTKNGKHLDNDVEPVEATEFQKWNKQHPVVAEISTDRQNCNKARAKLNFKCLLKHEKPRLMQWPIYIPSRRHTQLT